jgi:hypothetical protein
MGPNLPLFLGKPLVAINGRADNTIVKEKRTDNDLQNITQKTKDRTTRTLPKTGDALGYSRRVNSY